MLLQSNAILEIEGMERERESIWRERLCGLYIAGKFYV